MMSSVMLAFYRAATAFGSSFSPFKMATISSNSSSVKFGDIPQALLFLSSANLIKTLKKALQKTISVDAIFKTIVRSNY